MQEDKLGSNEYLLTRNQVRAGRVLAGLGVRDLAASAGMSPTAVSQIETGRTEQAHEVTLRALRIALEDQGVEFAPEGWVRHREDTDNMSSRGLESSLAKTIAKNCCEARKNLGMTRDDVAEAIGESVELYSRIELGSVLPPLAMLIRIADALALSTDEMFGRAEVGNRTKLVGMVGVNRTQIDQIERLLGVARPSALRVVTLILKEVIRLQRRKTDSP